MRFELKALLPTLIGMGLGVAAQTIQHYRRKLHLAEHHLGEAQAKYRILTESVMDGLYMLDINGAVTYFNPIILEFTGWKDAIGRHFTEFVHPDDRPAIKQHFHAALRGEYVHRFDVRVQHQNGTYHNIYMTISGYMVNGRIAGIMGVARDITLFRDQQNALIEREQRYRQLVEESPEAIIVHHAFKIAYANGSAAHLFGAKTADELVGVPLTDLTLPEEHITFEPENNIYQRERGSELSFGKVKRLDGTTLDVETFGTPIMYDGQHARQMTIRDLTYRQQAHRREIELAIERERTKILRDFISNASHDLKTPVSSIRLSLYLIKKYNDPIKIHEMAGVLEERFKHLERMIEDLFDMSRLDQDLSFNLNMQASHLNTFVRDVVRAHQASAVRKAIELDFAEDSQISKVEIAPDEFSRALHNLIDNALNYTPADGRVSVRTELLASRQKILIEVKDTGIGIDAESLPRIFDRFYRGDDARSTNTGGTGLGLPIAQRIVELHGGYIRVESVPQSGTTFSVFLPIKNHANS